MKKILICLGLLLLTGCTVNYNLEISEDKISENITGDILKNEFDSIDDELGDHTIYHFLHDEQYSLIDKSDLYKQSINDNSDKIDFNYSYDYKDNFNNSRVLNECYENVIFEENDDFYIIKLSGGFYCLLNSKITVNLTTDYSVLNSNADKKNGNVYTWYLEKDNTDIEVEISKVKKPADKNTDGDFGIFRLIGLAVLAVLSAATYYIYKKKNSRDF